MTGAVPPAGPGGGLPPALARVVTATEVPAALKSLPAGTAVEGRLVAPRALPAAATTPFLQTEHGTLTLSVRLPTGSQVRFELITHQPRLQLRPVMIDGRAVTPGTTTTTPGVTAGAATNPAGTATNPAGPAVQHGPGRALTATLLRTNPFAASGTGPSGGQGTTAGPMASTATATAAAGQPGSPRIPGLALTTGRPGGLVGLTLISGTATGLTPPGQGATTAGTTPGTAGPDPATGPATLAAGRATPGTTAPFRLTSVQPPGPDSSLTGRLPTLRAALNATLPPGGTAPGQAGGQSGTGTATLRLAGTALAPTPGGRPQVTTAAGIFTLATDAGVPRGSTVVLESTGRPAPPPTPLGDNAAARAAGPAPLVHGLAGSTGGGDPFPALRQALEALQASQPQTAQQAAAALPQAGSARMPQQLVFLFAALGLGDSGRGALGRGVMQGIERSVPGLSGRVTDELGRAGRGTARRDASGTEWRTHSLPVLKDNGLDSLELSLTSGGDREDDEGRRSARRREPPGTRFLVDLTFEAWGRLQFDGLVKRADKTFLELVVRSAEPLPPDLRKEVNGIFTRTCEAEGLVGSLTFRATGDFVEPVATDDGTGGTGVTA